MNPRALVVAVDVSPARPGTGGVGRYVRDLWDHLPSTSGDQSLDYAPLTNRPAAWRAAAGTRRGTPVPAARIRRPTLAWLLVEAPRQALDVGAAVLHGTTGRAPLGARPALVLTVHDTLLLDRPDLAPWRERVLAGWPQRLAIPRARRLICVSDDTRRGVLRRWPAVAARATVVHPGLASRWLAPPPALPAPLAARLGPRFWLHVGPTSRRKNVAALVLAFGAVRSRLDPAPSLVLVGPAGDDERSVRAAIAAAGAAPFVHRFAAVDDDRLHALYGAAELTACVALHEGFGLTALEASASGCPVVSSGRGGLPEAAPDGIAFAAGVDAAAIGRALAALAVDGARRAAMAGAGVRMASRRGWRAAAAATAHVYVDAAR